MTRSAASTVAAPGAGLSTPPRNRASSTSPRGRRHPALSRRLLAGLLAGLLLAGVAAAQEPPLSLDFHGTTFHYRYGTERLYEYTPAGQEDLSAWQLLLSFALAPERDTPELLAELANNTLALYDEHGVVIATDSVPATEDRDAEHFIAAVLGDPTLLEAVFARFMLTEHGSVITIYSYRIYSDDAGDAMRAWLGSNGPDVEASLMAWTGMPGIPALESLPLSD